MFDPGGSRTFDENVAASGKQRERRCSSGVRLSAQEANGWAGGVAPGGTEPPSRRQEVPSVEGKKRFDTLAPPGVCRVPRFRV